MHDAYEPVPILEKLPLQIDCLAAWGKLLTLNSSLLFYSLTLQWSIWVFISWRDGLCHHWRDCKMCLFDIIICLNRLTASFELSDPDSWVLLPTEDWLLVGTKPGHLLLYRIKKDAGRKCPRRCVMQLIPWVFADLLNLMFPASNTSFESFFLCLFSH